MASVLFAWELGANLGHVGTLLTIAKELRARGHQVHWLVAQPALVGALLQANGFSWLAAPTAVEERREGAPISYADILLRYGYSGADRLLGLVGAWRESMRLTGAKLVVADHAPSAMVAARTMGIPVMLRSPGFSVPPRRRPVPGLRPWAPVSAAQLLAAEDQALASINRVLAEFGKEALVALADLFAVEEDALVTFPELDHYADRGPARYWGGMPYAEIGEPPSWPDLPGRRLFAYLRGECPHWEAALAALQGLGLPTAIYFPGLPEEVRRRWQAPHLAFAAKPLDLRSTAAKAVVAVTYASPAATIAFLLAGKPLLLLPMHLEQYLLARRVVEMNAGLLIHPEQPAGDLRQPLERLLTEPAFRDNAAAFARKYAAFDQAQVLANLVRRAEEILQANRGSDK